MLQHKVELICRSHHTEVQGYVQRYAYSQLSRVGCGVHTNFTAPYEAVNERHEETKLTTMSQDERSA